MPNLLTHQKPLGSIDYSSGGRHTLEIPRDGILVQTNIRLQFTVTNSATPAVGPLWEALARLISRCEFIVNGRDTVISMDGPGLVARARYEFDSRPYGSDDTVILTGSAATVYDVIIPIAHFLPGSINPMICALPAERLGQLTLALTWAASDCSDFYTTPNAAVISAVTCTIEGEYLLNADPTQVYFARVLDQHEETVTATTANMQITVDTGTGLLYRTLMTVATADAIASDGIINELELSSGTTVFQKRKSAFIQAGNRHDYLSGSDAHQTGVYHLSTEKMGNPSMWLNTSREVMRSDLKLIADVTDGGGVDLVTIYREMVRPFKR